MVARRPRASRSSSSRAAASARVRGDSRPQLVVADVGCADDRQRGGERLGPVALAHVRDEALARLGRPDEQKAAGARVAAGRRPADQFQIRCDLLIGDRVRREAVRRVRLAEEQVGGGVVQFQHREHLGVGGAVAEATIRAGAKPRKYLRARRAATHARSMVPEGWPRTPRS